MVYQRTLNKIEEIKERPHHERRQYAAALALIVVAVLFVGWGLSFFMGSDSSSQLSSETAYPNETGTEEAATTSGARVRIQNESSAAGAASGFVQLDDEGYQIVPTSE
jgi:hypothetical protein